jgi:hypothetical protein
MCNSQIVLATGYVLISLIVFFAPPLLPSADVAMAAGDFEVYCGGVGIFLAKMAGAPAPGKLVLFSRINFSRARSEVVVSDRESGPTFMSFVMGASPTANAKGLPMAELWIDAEHAR